MLYPAELRALEGVRFIAQRIRRPASPERMPATEFVPCMRRAPRGRLPREVAHARRASMPGPDTVPLEPGLGPLGCKVFRPTYTP